MNESAKKSEKIDSTNVNVSATIANAENISRYGSAIKEHFVAYEGVDRSSGQILAKGLKNISKSKVNEGYRQTNIRQQAGFSAEVKTVAREKAQKIIEGKTDTLTIRTDDMVKQSNGLGGSIGGANECLYDIAEVDKNGIYIQGSARQLKFVGGDAKACTKKLLSPKYDKYRESEALLEIPSDFYDSVMDDLSQQAKALKTKIAKADNIDLPKESEKLARIEKTQSLLKKGKLSNEEAINARLHPKLSTAKDITELSNKAGINSAYTAAVIGGGISVIQNITSAIKGDKLPEDAAIDVVSNTAKAATSGYIVGFASSALKGALENAPKECLRSLANSNIPAVVVTSILEVGKTLGRFCNGEIDEDECFIELGEKGVGIIASTAGAAIGQILIPIPVVGGVVGSMVGYALSSAYYNNLATLIKDTKLSQEERDRIESECYQSIVAMKEFQLQLILAVNNYMTDHMIVFQNALSLMEESYGTKNVDAFIHGSNSITIKLGGMPLFETQEQCDTLMKSNTIIKI